MRKKAQYEFIPIEDKKPRKPRKDQLPPNLCYTITKYGTVAITEKPAKSNRYKPKCKVFTPAEIQEYIKNQKTGA